MIFAWLELERGYYQRMADCDLKIAVPVNSLNQSCSLQFWGDIVVFIDFCCSVRIVLELSILCFHNHIGLP